MRYDIVIIGGGIIGSSIAYYLARDGRAGEVAVIEPDPSYEWAATPRATGGVRQLFSRPENILMSVYSLGFYLEFPEVMAVDGTAAEIEFRQQGYLFLAGPSDAGVLAENQRTQTSLGAPVELLDADALKRRLKGELAVGLLLGLELLESGVGEPEQVTEAQGRGDLLVGELAG